MTATRPTGADLGRIPRRLHDEPVPPEPPHTLTDPLNSVDQAIERVRGGDPGLLADRPDHVPDQRRNEIDTRVRSPAMARSVTGPPEASVRFERARTG